MADKVWMKPPQLLGGEPREVEVDGADGELNRLMVAGWSQCAPPESAGTVAQAKKPKKAMTAKEDDDAS